MLGMSLISHIDTAQLEHIHHALDRDRELGYRVK